MSDYGDRFEFKRDPDNKMLVGMDGCHYDNEPVAFHFGLFELCGCGTPRDIYAFLLRCLRHFDQDSAESTCVSGIVEEVRRDPEIVAEMIAHFIDSKQLTDHGGSVYSAWLTPLGKQVLECGEMPGYPEL